MDMRKSFSIARIILTLILGLVIESTFANKLPLDFVVKGNVTDENGPIAGVTVTEKGTNNATTTDGSGNFSLSVKNSNSVLVFTYVGYKSEEVAIAGRSSIAVKIESTGQELSGVVVTALGITRAKKSLGYSVEEVGEKK